MEVSELFDLSGKVALITGGAGIVGRAISEGLAEAGAEVIIASRRLERCQELAEGLTRRGLSATALRLDLADAASVEGLKAEVMARWERLDILVNNAVARVSGARGFEEMSLDVWRRVLEVDGVGLFHICRALIPEMARQGGGAVINISSIYGLVAPDFRIYEGNEQLRSPASYGFIKGGMNMLTRYLATYYASKGVRVNAIALGGVYSGQPPSFVAKYCERCPMGRMASKDDIKGVVVFLASEAARYITGQVIPVDGGWTVW